MDKRLFVWCTGVYEVAFIAVATDAEMACEMIRAKVVERSFPSESNTEVRVGDVQELPTAIGVSVIEVHEWRQP